MTNKPEIKPCVGAVEELERAMYNANQWHADTQYKAGLKDVAEVCIELLSQSGYTITRAEPVAPSSDVETDIGTIECFARCHGGEFERDLLTHAKLIRAHIAALKEDNKRLREALTKYATADVTCSYVEVSSRAYEVHEHCEKWAQEALVQADGKAGG